MNTDTMTVTDTQKHFAALDEIGTNLQDVIYNITYILEAGTSRGMDSSVASAMYCSINYLTMLHLQLDDEVAALFAAHKEGKA